MLHDHPFPLLPWTAVLVAAAAAAISDSRSRRIPNALTAPLFGLGLVASSAAGGWPGLAEALGAALVLALPYVILFALAGGGAGDAKLMGALGAWLGLVHGFAVLAGVSIAGIGLALVHARRQGRLREVAASVGHVARVTAMAAATRGSVSDLARAMPEADVPVARKIPYGVAIFAGTAAAAVGVAAW